MCCSYDNRCSGVVTSNSMTRTQPQYQHRTLSPVKRIPTDPMWLARQPNPRYGRGATVSPVTEDADIKPIPEIGKQKIPEKDKGGGDPENMDKASIVGKELSAADTLHTGGESRNDGPDHVAKATEGEAVAMTTPTGRGDGTFSSSESSPNVSEPERVASWETVRESSVSSHPSQSDTVTSDTASVTGHQTEGDTGVPDSSTRQLPQYHHSTDSVTQQHSQDAARDSTDTDLGQGHKLGTDLGQGHDLQTDLGQGLKLETDLGQGHDRTSGVLSSVTTEPHSSVASTEDKSTERNKNHNFDGGGAG